MKIVLDNIIFALQNHGGISVVWYELASRLLTSGLDLHFTNASQDVANPLGRMLHIDGQRRMNDRSPLCQKLIRYRDERIKEDGKFIFHSSYYRICDNPHAINITTVHDFTYELYNHGLKRAVHSWQKRKAILHSVLGVPLDEVPTSALAVLLLLAAALTVPLVSLVSGPLGEELGWRGYLYPTLCEWMPRWKAMLLTGVVWGIWHTPLLIMGWDYGTAYAGYPVGGIVVMTLCTVCMGAFQCWLTDRSGNIWPSVLAHGALNVAFSFYLLGNNFCKGEYHPLLGVHPLTLLGGWTLIATGWVILVKTRSGWPEE